VTRTAYIDAIGGVAGDMLLGALMDAGADAQAVAAGLDSLDLPGLELRQERVTRHGISALRLVVHAAESAHVHRTWPDVRAILERGALAPRALQRAQLVFEALARAEGRIHGVPAEQVHFHEVGAIDAIADVVGTALALEQLEVDELVCSPLPVGRGVIDHAHGRLPLPAPAALELLRGAPVEGVDDVEELVTPTGAALVGALATGFGPVPAMQVEAIGYGAGARDGAKRPNVVRVVLGVAAAASATARTEVRLLEANLDDLPGQLVPDVADACWSAGALDVWVTPVQMKKGRPGVVVSALARPDAEPAVAAALLRHSTTLGVRVSAAHRWELERSRRSVLVDGQPVAIKEGRLDGELVNVWPEYDDCRRVADATGRPVKAVWIDAVAAARAAQA
jgi:uncharacterized protein (TIGR00299 family) protein